MTDTPITQRVQVAVGSGDWAEIRLDGEVVYRGHEDEAMERALELLGADITSDEITGPRVDLLAEAHITQEAARRRIVAFLDARDGMGDNVDKSSVLTVWVHGEEHVLSTADLRAVTS